MVDVKVSYAMLEHSEQSLRRIASELEGAGARRVADASIWGSSDFAGGMSNFVGNWERHRRELVDSLKNVAGICASARETFAGTDRQLGEKIAHAGEG